jgi:hypothetical protein
MFNLADIYLTIASEPSDAFISQRRKVITSLATDDAIGTHFPSWVELIWLGVSPASTGNQLAGTVAIVRAIQDEQPSFPTDPVERALDLRVTAAAILDQYLSESHSSKRGHALVLSSVILATSTFRRFESEPRYGQVVQSLRSTAQSVLDGEAASIRKRNEVVTSDIEGTDVSTLKASMTEAISDLVETVTANMRADREELQILWWVFGRHSKLLRASYDDLGRGDAVFSSATELATLTLVPPLPAAGDFLRSVLKDKSTLTLGQLISQSSLLSLKLAEAPESAKSIVRDHPTLLPLTWLAARLVDSDRSPWEAEFEKKTQIVPAVEKSTSAWAEQVFAERIVCSLIDNDWKAKESE